MKGSRSLLLQWHFMREDTFLQVKAGRKGAYAYIEDKQSGQKCYSKVAKKKGQVIETGVLDNRSTSIRAVVVDGKSGDREKGAWYREDAGGHRQNGKNASQEGQSDGRMDGVVHPGDAASYDDHEDSLGGGRLPYKYDVSYGRTTVASLHQHSNNARSTYAAIRSQSPHVKVKMNSDRYGAGKYSKVEWSFWAGAYVARTGVLYNKNDRIQVCVKGPNGFKCGKWHTVR